MRKLSGILIILFCLTWGSVSPGWGVEVGEALPNFSLQSFDGRTFSDQSLIGQPVLMIFWNTWCHNCMRELPEVALLARKYASQDLTILAVNTGINDSEQNVRAYWKQSGYLFPSGIDQDMLLLSNFQIIGVPVVLLADAKGVVRYKQALLPANIDELLTGPAR